MTVSTDDVAALLGRDLTGDEDDRVGRLIDIAESAVEAALPGFSFATGTEAVNINWHDPNIIWTPRYPVTAINRLTIDAVPVDLTWARFDPKGKIELHDTGGWVINRFTPVGWAAITIDYDYGLDPPPPVLAGIVASMVAATLRRQATNPGNVFSEKIGSYTVSYERAGEQAIAEGEMPVPALPARWKRAAAVSVPFARYR